MILFILVVWNNLGERHVYSNQEGLAPPPPPITTLLPHHPSSNQPLPPSVLVLSLALPPWHGLRLRSPFLKVFRAGVPKPMSQRTTSTFKLTFFYHFTGRYIDWGAWGLSPQPKGGGVKGFPWDNLLKIGSNIVVFKVTVWENLLQNVNGWVASVIWMGECIAVLQLIFYLVYF